MISPTGNGYFAITSAARVAMAIYVVVARSATRILQRPLVVGSVVVALSTAYAGWTLDQGWIPHDEGQLGHTAERILNGELPHRDFVEPYTGGLGYLNALAFWLGGVRSEVLRWEMLPFFAVFSACIFLIAKRIVSAAWAATVTFLCSCLTLPIYPAGMPSWYNLFLATYGTVALLRHLDTKCWKWLVVAGVCGGLSILVKVTGLYFVAAALLWLVYREQLQCDPLARRALIFSILASLALTVFAGLGFFFLRRENPLMDVVHFVLPFTGLAAFVLRNEWQRGRGNFTSRFVRLAAYLTPFCCGVAIPLLLFVLPYVITQSVINLVQGMFVLPAQRLTGARMSFPDPQWLLMAIPLASLFGVGLFDRRIVTKTIAVMCCLLLVGLLAVSHTSSGYVAIFQAIRNLLPFLAMIALVMLFTMSKNRLDDARREELFLLTAAAFFISLVQFPYSGGFYFFYVAPLGVLLAAYLVSFQPNAPRQLHCAALCFVTLFLLLRMHNPNPAITGGPYAPQTPTAALQIDRCRLTVSQEQANLYNRLITAVREHSGDGSYIYAAPDCPEVYFLSGRRNPTRSLYDLFDVRDAASYQKLVQDLDQLGVQVVVLKQCSEFSTRLAPELAALLEQRFQHRESFQVQGRDAFIVLWRS